MLTIGNQSYIVTTTNYVCSVATPVAYNALAVGGSTSTVYTTEYETVTSCAPTVTGCPGSSSDSGYPTDEPPPSTSPPSATTIGCVGNPVTSWKTVTTVRFDHFCSFLTTTGGEKGSAQLSRSGCPRTWAELALEFILPWRSIHVGYVFIDRLVWTAYTSVD